jgi:hypothetical protein
MNILEHMEAPPSKNMHSELKKRQLIHKVKSKEKL